MDKMIDCFLKKVLRESYIDIYIFQMKLFLFIQSYFIYKNKQMTSQKASEGTAIASVILQLKYLKKKTNKILLLGS